jgi:hypothetical protein
VQYRLNENGTPDDTLIIGESSLQLINSEQDQLKLMNTVRTHQSALFTQHSIDS